MKAKDKKTRLINHDFVYDFISDWFVTQNQVISLDYLTHSIENGSSVGKLKMN